MRALLAIPLLAIPLLAGCAAPDDDGLTSTALISTMGFSWEDEGVSDGFDLDDAVTAQDGPTGCGVADFTSSDGVPGIDNSFAPVLPALENVGGDALEPLVQESIDNGELLILIEMLDLDDETDDDCVDLHVQRGVGPPAIGTDGLILPGQTFERDLDAPDSFVECATITDGLLRAEGFGMRLPLNIFDEFVDFELRGGILEMQIDEETGTYGGLFAGGVNTQEIIDNVNTLDGIPDEIPILVETVMDVRADLAPVAGNCTEISITFRFGGVSAYLFAEEDE